MMTRGISPGTETGAAEMSVVRNSTTHNMAVAGAGEEVSSTTVPATFSPAAMYRLSTATSRTAAA